MALQPPYAQLTVSVNGGAPQTGAITVSSGQTIQLGMGSTSGVLAQTFEIYGYPPGFSPGGSWALGSDGYTWQNNSFTPASFSTGANWGKWMLRLRINGNPLSRNSDGSPNTAYQSQLTDESTALTWWSTHGVKDLGVGETNQFNPYQGWVGDHRDNLRTLETVASSGGGSAPGFLRFSSGPQTLTHAQNGSIVLTDTTGGSFTVKLPTGTNGSDADEFTMVDSTNGWATHALTVTTDSGTVPIVDPAQIGGAGGSSTSVSFSVARGSVTLVYDKTQGFYLVV